MSVPDISAEDLARVEAMLREDIAWAVKHGPGFDPSRGPTWTGERWVTEAEHFAEPACAVCAIGALCLRRQPECDPHQDAPEVAAAVLGVPANWCSRLYFAVMDARRSEDRDRYTPQVWGLAERLCDFGDEAMAARGAK